MGTWGRRGGRPPRPPPPARGKGVGVRGTPTPRRDPDGDVGEAGPSPPAPLPGGERGGRGAAGARHPGRPSSDAHHLPGLDLAGGELVELDVLEVAIELALGLEL